MVGVATGVAKRFSGFPEGGMQFFLDLQAEQSRTWFKAHQDEFVRLWKEPLELFVAELQDRLVDTYPGLAEVAPHFFRIQRDTRFAKDKTPYKTYVAADLPLRPVAEGVEQHGVPGLYVSFGLEGEYVAFGAWHMSPEVLRRYREALDHPKRGAEAQKIVDSLLAEGWQLESMESLKRTPPPYPQDHPRAELLKRKGLAMATSPTEDLLNSPKLLDWAEDRLRRVAPLAKWLDKHVSS
jgi:uncharacterized protein (TIGR02453 family)